MNRIGKTVLAGLVVLALAGGVYYFNHPSPVQHSNSPAANVNIGTIPVGDKEVVLEHLGMY